MDITFPLQHVSDSAHQVCGPHLKET